MEPVGKKIIYDDEIWKIEQVIRPNEFERFLLCSRKDETCAHDDGTSPVEMILLDCANHSFSLATKQTISCLESKKKHDSHSERFERRLYGTWLDDLEKLGLGSFL